LKIRENRLKWENDYRSYNFYRYTIEEIINEFVPVSEWYLYQKEKNHKINPTFQFCICERPYITSSIRLFDAVKILRHANEHWNLNEYNKSFVERAYFHIHEVSRYLSKYCKYKKQQNKINQLLRYLNDHNYDTLNNTRLLELFLIFFEIQTYIESLKR